VSRFERILAAFDGSDPARNALEAALDLALELEASVEVLAVEGALPRYAATIGEVDDAVRERERFFARVLGEARAIARERGLEVTSTLRPGHPAEEIVRHAESTGANLIVVGHRGHVLHGFPLGSTAARVTRHAHCPVLVVR
jgi:nucleotide-binding universal stress UspA family protein